MSDLPGQWNEPATAVVDELTRWGTFAADDAVIAARPTTAAGATRVAVRAAVRALLANGLIEALIPDEVWFVPRPPEAQ